MIKINEVEMLKLINNGDLNVIKNYIDNEILMQIKTDILDVQRNKNFIKLAKKFKKEAIKSKRPALAGAFTQNDYTCLCDGFRIFRLKQPIGSFGNIEKVSSEVILIDVMSFFSNTEGMKEVGFDLKDLQLKYKEYKSLSTQDKKGVKNKVYSINLNGDVEGVEKIYLNIEYLIDAHNILDFNNCKFYAKTPTSPLLIVDDKGNDALVLPVRV